MGQVSFVVRVQDLTGTPTPNSEGQVYLEVFSVDGGTRLQVIESPTDGEVPVTIEGSEAGSKYMCRLLRTSLGAGLYSPDHLFTTRFSHKVYDPLPLHVSTNDAFITIPSEGIPPSSDPNMCRLVGRFKHLDGRPYDGYCFTLHTRNIPRLLYEPVPGGLYGSFFGGDRIDLRTIEGLVITELPRNGLFTAVLPDLIDEEVQLYVPDAPAWDMMLAMFLVPYEISFNPQSVTVQAGKTEYLKIDTFLMSNGRPANICDIAYNAQDMVEFEVTAGADNVEVGWQPGESDTVFVRGIAAGSATAIAKQREYSRTKLPMWLPKPPIQQTPIAVTVV